MGKTLRVKVDLKVMWYDDGKEIGSMSRQVDRGRGQERMLTERR